MCAQIFYNEKIGGMDGRFRLGDFEVDPLARQLLREGQVVPLQQKPIQLLLFLLENAGRVASAGLAIVLYRFIRVSNSEQLASSELEAARTVQQLLIPAVQPAAPGFSVESVYLPSRQVGGDFFLTLPDVEASGNRRLLVIIGDVSGKGLQAAMVVSTIIGCSSPLSLLLYSPSLITCSSDTSPASLPVVPRSSTRTVECRSRMPATQPRIATAKSSIPFPVSL